MGLRPGLESAQEKSVNKGWKKSKEIKKRKSHPSNVFCYDLRAELTDLGGIHFPSTRTIPTEEGREASHAPDRGHVIVDELVRDTSLEESQALLRGVAAPLCSNDGELSLAGHALCVGVLMMFV